MISRYLLDTNTCSYIIRGTRLKARDRLRKVSVSRVSISVITQAELLFGVAKKPEAVAVRAAVLAFLDYVSVLAWDSAAASCYAQMRAELERRGFSLGALDMLIAAHALAAGAVLVTSDRSFKAIKGVRIEDWSRPR